MDKLVTFEEIALQLGITKQQAYKDYQRGMAKLKRVLKRKPELAAELFSHLETGREFDKVISNRRNIVMRKKGAISFE